MYKSCLRGSHYYVPGELTKVGSLSIENRLLHYLIAYILVQRNTNHTQPTLNDLKLMFAIKESILVNWPSEILKVMSGIEKFSSKLPAYEICISRVINQLGIDTSDMEIIAVNSRGHLVGDNLIHKMNIYKFGAEWMYQEDHNTTIDLDLSNEEEGVNQGEKNPEQQHVEASTMSQGPSFGLADLDVMEQHLNEQIDSMNEESWQSSNIMRRLQETRLSSLLFCL
ncbi:hypothetical protein Lal_00033270 [Lupinus albus]|uniref:Uncharacterized protein n=1 Tax=Lupinus albus TaxID=3870 RepID=A0A6A4QFW0_LUPAL|nr:hypothetical protein Lalb_Chr06g0174101 [Lupinus albus]KAF1879612.1 hypothetical protein Lal_00033270 [Lupinus albus]